jgi:phage baseplate assembly protein W
MWYMQMLWSPLPRGMLHDVRPLSQLGITSWEPYVDVVKVKSGGRVR